MFRRSLFWGLTVMLGAVLVWLIINGRKEEARLASAAPAEVVQTARLSPTRAFAPGDLEVAEADVAKTNREGLQAQIGPVTIRNRGEVDYHGTMLRLQCLDNSGKVIDTWTRLVPDTIAPGQSISISVIHLEKIPPGAVRFHISIASSDVGPAPSPETESRSKTKTKEIKQ